MKLSLTVTDQRVAHGRGYPTADKTEDYIRVGVTELEGNREVLAGFLRAVADDLAPVFVAVEGVELT